MIFILFFYIYLRYYHKQHSCREDKISHFLFFADITVAYQPRREKKDEVCKKMLLLCKNFYHFMVKIYTLLGTRMGKRGIESDVNDVSYSLFK